MLPDVYGFSWSAGNIIFLGIFYSVVSLVMITLGVSVYRAARDFRLGRDASVRWEADFEELPATSRACRHQLTGEMKRRVCQNGFECGSCAFHGKQLRQGATPPAEANGPIGIEVSPDCLYHRGHTWVRLEEDGTATVGLDDFGSRLLARPEKVILPEVGARLRINDTAWQLGTTGSLIRILSPLAGEVIETGGPKLGWYLRLKPAGAGFETQHLLRGAEVRPWLLKELERLQVGLAVEGVGASLADGGEVVDDVPKAYPDADWDTIRGDIFLQP